MTINLFQMQRELRQRRESAVRKGVVAVIDIGTSKISCMILQFAPNLQTRPDETGRQQQPSMGAFRVVGVATTQSRGVRFGEIVEMAETERAIRTAVQRAQKMATMRVDHAFVCFSGGRPRSYGLSGEVSLPHGQVGEIDIGNAIFDCDVPPYGHERQPLQAMPVCYKIDEHANIADPRGRIGNKLSVDMHMLTVSETSIQNIMHCISRCDLELTGLFASAHASGISTLSENEQELGAACIDFGAGSTGISVFIKKQLIYADCVRLGGDHITRDIQQGLQIPLEVAERIKTVNGGLVATGRDDRDFIEVPHPMAQWENDRRHITRSELIGVMRPRVEEILEEVRDRLDAAGFEFLPSQQIVLTGGSSEIPGLDQVASRILGRQCRIGKHLRVMGLPQAAATPGFSAGVGVALNLSDPRDLCWSYEMPMDRVGTLRLRRAVRWFRDHW